MQIRSISSQVAALAFACCAGPATAGGFFGNLGEVIVPNGIVAPEKIEAVAGEVGVLTPLEFKGVGTLEGVVEDACRGVSPEYLQSFEAKAGYLNPEIFGDVVPKLDTPIGEPGQRTTIYVPFCLGASNPRYLADDGDQVWSIYSQQRSETWGISDWSMFQSEMQRLNGPDILTRKINIGETLVLPTSTMTVPVDNSLAEAVRDRLLEEPQVDFLEDLITVNTDPGWGIPDQNEASLIRDVAQCKDDSDFAALAEAGAALWDVTNMVRLNDYVATHNDLERYTGAVRVGVFDTGLQGNSDLLMRDMVSPLLATVPLVDQEAQQADSMRAHGTSVTLTASGGPFLSAIHPIVKWLDLSSYRLTDSLGCVTPANSRDRTCHYGAQPMRFVSAMRMAEDTDPKISLINVSMSFPVPFPELSEYTQPGSDFLIVTSAGNGGGVIDREHPVYPAMYGGERNGNVLTVAAVTISGKLLPSSGRSADYVDLAAWGCNVPVMQFDERSQRFVQRFLSGTSFAAPQVTFTAAMIKRESLRKRGPWTPVELKTRLLASADISVDLWKSGAVKHGRILNIAKAIAVHSDVVEMKDGTLNVGSLTVAPDGPENVEFCADVIVPRRNLLKVTQLAESPDDLGLNGDRVLIYSWLDDGTRSLLVQSCRSLTVALSFRDAVPPPREDGQVPENDSREINPADVRDIVMAMH